MKEYLIILKWEDCGRSSIKNDDSYTEIGCFLVTLKETDVRQNLVEDLVVLAACPWRTNCPFCASWRAG